MGGCGNVTCKGQNSRRGVPIAGRVSTWRDRGPLLGIVLLALLLRSAWLCLEGGPILESIDEDRVFYESLGRNLALGRGFVVDDPAFGVVIPGKPTAFWTPVFPLFLAAVYSMTGHNSPIARWASSILGAVFVLLVYALARRVADRVDAHIAAGVVALHPLYVVSSTSLLSENLSVFLVGGLILLIYRLGDRPAWGPSVGAGLLWGGAALTRPELALLGGLLCAAGIPLSRSHRSGYVKSVALAAAIAGIVVAPWLIRNAQLLSRPVFSTRLGYSLWYQNAYQYERLRNQWTAQQTDAHYADSLMVRLRQADGEAARDRILRRRGMEFIADHPVLFGKMALKRVYATFPFLSPSLRRKLWPHVQQFLFGEDARVKPELAVEIKVPWPARLAEGMTLPLMILASVGIASAVSRIRILLPMITAIGFYVALAALVAGSPRIRLTVEFLTVILAVGGGVYLVDRVRQAIRGGGTGRTIQYLHL